MNGDSSGEGKEFHAPFEGQLSPLTRTIAHLIAAARSLSWPEPSGSPDGWFPLAATAIPPLSQRKCLLPPTGPSKGANRSSVVVGIIHGFGAETPTQLLLLLMTAKLGGITVGLQALLLFIVGMGIVNTLFCVVMAQMFLKTSSSHKLQGALSGITAGYSFAIGTIMLAGR